MKLKSRPQTTPPGIVGVARIERSATPSRRPSDLLTRLSGGEIAVIDHLDLDGPTAEALVDAGVAVVLNRSAMISGRFPNRGPQILLDAGIHVVDQVTPADAEDLSRAIGEGRRVRVHEGDVLHGDQVVASGRWLSHDDVARQLTEARSGLTAQLQTLTHNSVEFLRREEALLLHGDGVPRLRTALEGRAVVVIADGPDDDRELRLLRRYLREVKPVVISVGEGVEVARRAGLRPDIVVLDGRTPELPAAKTLRSAGDVVLTEAPGGSRPSRTADDRFERIGVRPLHMQTTAALDDAALLLADAAGARPIVTVGVRASIEEFLDGSRGGLASGYLTRLKTGQHLVDATAVPALYSGQLRARHVYLVLLVGLLAVAVAIATTPVGHQWATELGHQLHDLLAGQTAVRAAGGLAR